MVRKRKLSFLDSWLLLAIIYAYKEGKANLAGIIKYGDYINHAIFSHRELAFGISRLLQLGYVRRKDNEYIPTKTLLADYTKFSKRRNTLAEELQFTYKWINSSHSDSSILDKSKVYIEISKEAVEDAYEKYRNEGFDRWRKRRGQAPKRDRSIGK